MNWVQLKRPAPWPQAASPRRVGTRGDAAALTLLMSPLKTTSSAFSCSTFRASSSWQASASWASYGREKPGVSRTACGQRAGEGGTRRGRAALTSWSSFTRSCSCSLTTYSSSHLQTAKGQRLGAGSSRLRSPPPARLAQAQAPAPGLLPQTGGAGQKRVAPGSPPAPSSPAAFPEPPASHHLRATAAALVPRRAQPDQLSGWPRPPPSAHTTRPGLPPPVLRSGLPPAACTRTELV